MSDHGIRNLDQLQEDDSSGMPRSVSLTLIALGGACVIFGAVALSGRATQPRVAKADPLGDLVSGHAGDPAASASGPSPTELSPGDVTFPRILSDDGQPTTALAVVRAGARPVASVAAPDRPPPATDRLPVVPLPAETVLEASPIVTRPRDALTKAASDAAQLTVPVSTAGASSPGHEGGYQLQVSSFHTQGEADAFADQLRARGHKAYVLEAHVPGRGTWFRVRVGPFATQHAATQYRAAFESREHVVPFLVPPDTTARAH